MQKKFNITGSCNAQKHYVVDISGKLRQVLDMVEDGAYFTINRPRQYGKTSMLAALTKHFWQQPDYIPITMSFATLGIESFKTEQAFCSAFLSELEYNLTDVPESFLTFFTQQYPLVKNIRELGQFLRRMLKKYPIKWVLLIDEVDENKEAETCLSFLRVLRNHYLNRANFGQPAFHSVILAGVHDVKNLKRKIRSDVEANNIGNSPWNIATDFEVKMSFSTAEIQNMLADYTADTGVKMNQELIAQTIYDYTSGYPFLVSHICKIIDEKILPHKTVQTWTKKDVEKAMQYLTKKGNSNTNFESLIHKLEKYPQLYQLLFDMMTRDKMVSYNIHNPLINLGLQYGIFKKNGKLQIHNKIYEQILYDYLISKVETKTTFQPNNYNVVNDFFLPTGGLNMKKIFRRFQLFMKEQYNVKQDQVFLETNGRLLFMAFIRPIINGQGHMFREAQISEEKRLDLVITYNEFTYIIELKRWAGEKRHQEGIKQLVNYLDYKNVAEGYLLIFDFRVRNRAYQEVEQTYQQKKLFITWV